MFVAFVYFLGEALGSDSVGFTVSSLCFWKTCQNGRCQSPIGVSKGPIFRGTTHNKRKHEFGIYNESLFGTPVSLQIFQQAPKLENPSKPSPD